MSRRGSEAGNSEDERQKSLNFEVALQQLEESVKLLEQGNLPLEQSLQQYAAAVQLISACQSQLENAERKVEMLSGFDSAGNPVVQTIEDQGNLSLDDKQTARSQRRSAKSARGGIARTEECDEAEKDQRLF